MYISGVSTSVQASLSPIPINSQNFPDAVMIGPISIPVNSYPNGVNSYVIDLSSVFALKPLAHGVQSLYIDCSGCFGDTQITIPGTQQAIVIPSGHQGYIPIAMLSTSPIVSLFNSCHYVANNPQYSFADNVIKVSFFNVPHTLHIWNTHMLEDEFRAVTVPIAQGSTTGTVANILGPTFGQWVQLPGAPLNSGYYPPFERLVTKSIQARMANSAGFGAFPAAGSFRIQDSLTGDIWTWNTHWSNSYGDDGMLTQTPSGYVSEMSVLRTNPGIGPGAPQLNWQLNYAFSAALTANFGIEVLIVYRPH